MSSKMFVKHCSSTTIFPITIKEVFGYLNIKIENVSGQTKYKEGNNRPSSVNIESLINKHNKARNKCDTLDNAPTVEPRV